MRKRKNEGYKYAKIPSLWDRIAAEPLASEVEPELAPEPASEPASKTKPEPV